MKEIKSIGLIETLGMVGAVEAADAALKAANVTLLGYEFNGAGYVVIKLSGDVSAVQAAVSSGGATAQRLGNLVATHVIARPDEQVIDRQIRTPDNVPPFTSPDDSPSSSTPSDPVPQAPKPSGPGAVKTQASPPAAEPVTPAQVQPGAKPLATAGKPAPKPVVAPKKSTKPKGKK